MLEKTRYRWFQENVGDARLGPLPRDRGVGEAQRVDAVLDVTAISTVPLSIAIDGWWRALQPDITGAAD